MKSKRRDRMGLELSSGSDRLRQRVSELEQRLAEAEQRDLRHQALLENSHAGYFLVDRDGYWRRANPAFCRMLGYDATEELLGHHFRETLFEEDLPATWGLFEQLIGGRPVRSGRIRRRRKDGTAGYYEFTANPVVVDDAVLGAEGFLLEVTQQHLAEQRLRENEAWLRQLLASMKDLVFVINASGHFQEQYPPASQDFYRQPEDFRGKHYRDCLPPDLAEQTAAAMAALDAGADLQTYEYGLEIRGRDQWFEVNASRIAGLEDRPPAYLFVVRNVTEHKLAIRELTRTTEELERYFNSSLDLLCVADAEGHFLRLNPQWESVLGYTVAELTGRSFLDLVHPDDLKSTLAALSELRQQKAVLNFENRYRCADGSYRWIEWRSRPQGNLIYAAARDITDRKRAEQELRKFKAIADASPHGYCILQADGTAIYANEAWASMHGYTSAELQGRPVSIFHTSRQMHRVKRLLERLRRDGHFTAQEVGHRRKDGSSFLTQMDAVLIRDDHGRPAFLAGMAVDITDRKRAERDKAAFEEGLRQAQKLEAIGTLASGIAHDFNNLLTAIFGYTDLARSVLPADHPAVSSLEMVDQSARQARGVINALLTFSRRQVTEKTATDLVGVVRDSLRLVRRLLPGSIEVITELPADQRIWIKADATQLQQVILNLSVNARDAMPAGGRLTVRLEPPTADGSQTRGEAVLHVSDTGCGIPRSIQSRILEPFFTTKPRGLGTGLGLPVSVSIIQEHGGRLEFSSRHRQGTTFTIRLPCCDPPRPDSAASGPSQPAAACQGLVILSVPDDHVRSIMTSCIRALGCDVLPVGEVADLLDAFRAHAETARVVVVDFDSQMAPVVDALIADEPALRSVPLVITCNRRYDRPSTASHQSLHVLLKPFQMTQLTNLISHLLTLPRVAGNS